MGEKEEGSVREELVRVKKGNVAGGGGRVIV